MKRNFFTAILFTVTLLFLTGCSSTKLADAFDAETVETMAREAADHLIAGEYDENIAMMSDVMKNALSAETRRKYGHHERTDRFLRGI